jgi:peptidoglycan/LPS O-acetylase OafA/YrhL
MGTLRFLLALAVALVHGGSVYGYRIMGGQQAVQIFYIISGFLITLILNRKYEPTARGNWLFYSNRAARIFVPYWVILAGAVAVGLVVYRLFGLPNDFRAPPGVSDQGNYPGVAQFIAAASDMSLPALLYVFATNILIVGQDVSMWLAYQAGGVEWSFNALRDQMSLANFNPIEPAWSLAVELMFYALAPFLVRRHLAVIVSIAVGCTALRVVAYAMGLHNVVLRYMFFPFELGLFMAGAVSYRLYQQLETKSWLSAKTALSVTTTVIALVLLNDMIQGADEYPYALYCLIVLALPFLFDFCRRQRWDRWIGELSYPLYLLHLPVQTSLHWAALPFGGAGYGARMTAISIGISIAAAIAVHMLVVVPLDRWRERRLYKQEQPPEPVRVAV